jgi:hypothetical protein
MDRNRKDPFEIEHIWANHPEQHPELSSEQDFADQRKQVRRAAPAAEIIQCQLR